MSGIKIPISADLSTGDLDKAAQQLQQRLNAMGQQIAQVNKVKFTPVDKTTVDDLRRVQQQFETLVRVSGGLRQKLMATGQRNSNFADIDWSRMYSDARSQARAMQQAFEYTMGGGNFGPPPDAGSTNPPGRNVRRAPDPNPNRSPPGGGRGGGGNGGMGGMATDVAQAGLRASGPVGGVAANALGTGMSSGFGAGLMGLVGGMLALGVGKAIGAVREKVGAAEQEAIQYDTLKRSLGDVNVSFNLLRDSVRTAAKDINVNFDEAQRLAVTFARLSNATQEQARTLGEEISIGGGLSRSFGLDPSQGVGFSAQMRLFGVTQNEQDSRRMALVVGETIARASGFSQAGQILQAISSYAEQQTRLGLNSANVGGFAGYLSAAAGSGIPGLDPTGAAGLMSRVNSAIQAGGAAGEAGQNFFGYLGRQMGLDPLQMAVLREQGAFGTGRSAFGSGSVYSRFAAANGLGTPGAGGSDQMLITSSMNLLRQQYGGNPLLMANAAQNLFGIGMNQAMVLSMLQPAQLGGMDSRMGRLGINLGSIDSSSFNLLGQVEAGDRNALALVAQNLGGRGTLSATEQRALDSAWASGNDETLRDTLATLIAKYGQEETEGEKVRNSIAGVERVVQEFATSLVPLTADIRSGVMYLAGERGGSPSDIRAAVLRSESAARVGDIEVGKASEIEDQRALIGKLTGEYNDTFEARRKEMWAGTLTDEKLADYNQRLADINDRKTKASERIRELFEEQQKLIEAENTALAARIEAMREEERKRRKAEDDAMAARAEAGGGGSASFGNPAIRFPTTGPASFATGGGLGAGPVGGAANGGGAGIIGPEVAAALDAEGVTDPTQRRNVAAMLAGISGVEGAGWNTVVGGGTFGDYGAHPNRVGLVTGDGPSTAAGAFQITGTTWRGQSGRQGLNDFSPTNQARAAIGLMRGRGALGYVLNGDFGSAAGRLGSEWQGLPTGASANQGRRSWAEFYRHVQEGGARYDQLTAMPTVPGSGPPSLGSGMFDPNPISGSFTHRFELSPDASRFFNPLPPVSTTFGPPVPSGVQ